MAHHGSTADRGRSAARPQDIPRSGWRDIALRVKDEIKRDHVPVVAAGVAFFGLLAIFPAITALISLAGLIYDPQQIREQLQAAASALPENAAQIIQSQAETVAGGGTGIGFAALGGLLLTFYSASKGMRTLIEGMNIAYDEEEKRGFIAKNLAALGLTVLLIVGVLIALAATVIAPAVVASLGLTGPLGLLITYGRWILLALLALMGLAVIYRFGPSRESPRWRWVSPRAIAATVTWIIASIAFSIYVRNFGAYNETYGALGGVIILLIWLWVSAFIVLLGAELNAEMEHQTRRDTTSGPERPMGSRGAEMADTLGESPGRGRSR